MIEGDDEVHLTEAPVFVRYLNKAELSSVAKGQTRILLDKAADDGYKKLLSPGQIGSLFASKAFENVDVFTEDFFKNLDQRLVTMLLVKEGPEVSYKFSNTFRGETYILFPFQCFVKVLSKIGDKNLRSRLFHLIQSSGSGMTRLCFELLKSEGKGIYCVYRQPGSTGYPPTTPWLQQLIERFKTCSSNEEAVRVCLHFIESAVICFHDFKADIQSVIDLFEGEITLDFNLDFKAVVYGTLEEHGELIVKYCREKKIDFSLLLLMNVMNCLLLLMKEVI